MVKVKGGVSGRVTEEFSVILVELFGINESLLLWVDVRVDEVVDFIVFGDFFLAENFFDEELKFDVVGVKVGKDSDETVDDGFEKVIDRKKWFKMSQENKDVFLLDFDVLDGPVIESRNEDVVNELQKHLFLFVIR